MDPAKNCKELGLKGSVQTLNQCVAQIGQRRIEDM